jgi:hypothetical protein
MNSRIASAPHLPWAHIILILVVLLMIGLFIRKD